MSSCRCGKCCKYFMMPLAKIPKDIEKCIPVPFRVDKAYVTVIGACKHLVEGKEATCSIYETRPEACRNFECTTLWMPNKIGEKIFN